MLSLRFRAANGATKRLVRYFSASHWGDIEQAPPDGILGLNQAFDADRSPNKVNLGVGAYRDDNGKPYILPSVKIAEERVLKKAEGHEYAGIGGIQSYIDLSLLFGKFTFRLSKISRYLVCSQVIPYVFPTAYGSDSLVVKEERVAAIQTLSGTGACRVMAHFIARFKGEGTPIYMPNPTWGNHIPIMNDSGLTVRQYRYFDPSTCRVDFDGMREVFSILLNSAFCIGDGSNFIHMNINMFMAGSEECSRWIARYASCLCS